MNIAVLVEVKTTIRYTIMKKIVTSPSRSHILSFHFRWNGIRRMSIEILQPCYNCGGTYLPPSPCHSATIDHKINLIYKSESRSNYSAFLLQDHSVIMLFGVYVNGCRERRWLFLTLSWKLSFNLMVTNKSLQSDSWVLVCSKGSTIHRDKAVGP